MMLDAAPIVGILTNREDIRAKAETVELAAGEMFFQEDDPSRYIFLRQSGTCMLSRNARPIGEARRDQPLDLVAVLGGLAHSQTAIATTDCAFLRWDVDMLWQDEAFSIGARRYLAEHVQEAQSGLAQLQAPIHYQPYTAQVHPGPFVFPNSTILFLFCRVEHDNLRLPAGVSRIGKGLLIGIADFPSAYYHHDLQSRFSSTETTFFVPVRIGVSLGLFVPYIYPSTYEPILLGREIYGFPKQLGQTVISDRRADLSVAGEDVLSLGWQHEESASEARIVGAFGQLFGVTGRITAAAFAIGDALLTMMNVPFYRRVSVFNHKQVPGADTKHGTLTYDVDQLTQAIFSVEHWQRIQQLPDAALHLSGGVFRDWGIRLDAAYHTQLTMRLSTGRVVRDYRV